MTVKGWIAIFVSGKTKQTKNDVVRAVIRDEPNDGAVTGTYKIRRYWKKKKQHKMRRV